MPFFQNPFPDEYRGNLLLSDRSYQMTFVCPPHSGRGRTILRSIDPGKDGVFDLSGTDAKGNSKAELILHYAIDPNLVQFASITIDCVGADTASEMTVPQIVANMNANSNFSSFFTARTMSSNGKQSAGPPFVIHIESTVPGERIKFYVDNTGTETVLKYNLKSGLAELPTYFSRHNISERFNFSDSTSMLVELSLDITNITAAGSAEVTTRSDHGLTTGDTVTIAGSNSTPSLDGSHTVTVTGTDTFTVAVTTSVAGDRGYVMDEIQRVVIEEGVNNQNKLYGFVAEDAKLDWELYSGRSGLFNFTNVISGVGSISTTTVEIVYHAGAKVGDLARKIIKQYDGSSNLVNQFEIPYTLEDGDVLSPP